MKKMEFVKFFKKSVFSFILVILFGITLSVPTYAASFNMNPASKTFERGCKRSVDVMMNVSGEFTNAAEVEIEYDPTKIDIVDSIDNQDGTQIKEGSAFQVYNFNSVDETNGIIKLAGFSFVPVNTNVKFGTIEFISLNAADTTGFNIRFDGEGETKDSNIASSVNNTDLLDSVTNGTYAFIPGPCQSDNQEPNVIFTNPTNNRESVELNTNINFRITDNQSGTNLSTLEFDLNGSTFLASSAEVDFDGDDLDYDFTLDPPVDLPEDRASTFTVSGEDNAGNAFEEQIIFNLSASNFQPPTDPEDLEAPTVIFKEPQNLDTNQILDRVELSILDEQSGVNEESVEVIINGSLFTLDDEGVSLEGDVNDLDVTVDVNRIIDPNAVSYVNAKGTDNAGNEFDEQIIFNLPTSPLFITCNNVPTREDQPRPICINQTNVEGNENLFFQDDTIAELENNIGFLGIVTLGFGLSYLGLSLFRLFYTGRLYSWFNKNAGQRIRGVVYDVLTNDPVKFASIRIKDDVGKVIKNFSADRFGRYRFSDLKSDKYYLHVSTVHYGEYVKSIEVDKKEEFYFDIPLTPISQDLESSMLRKNISILLGLLSKFTNILHFVGLVFAGFASYFIPNAFNIGIFAAFAVLPLIWIFNALFRMPGNIRLILEDRVKVTNCIVKVFTKKDLDLVDVKITNSKGIAKLDLVRGDLLFAVNSPKYKLTDDSIRKTSKGTSDIAPSFREIEVSNAQDVINLDVSLRN